VKLGELLALEKMLGEKKLRGTDGNTPCRLLRGGRKPCALLLL